MKHLKRIVLALLALTATALATAIKTPAVTNFVSQHPGAAAFVALGPALLAAIVGALNDNKTTS